MRMIRFCRTAGAVLAGAALQVAPGLAPAVSDADAAELRALTDKARAFTDAAAVPK